jgi:hypothetical protein
VRRASRACCRHATVGVGAQAVSRPLTGHLGALVHAVAAATLAKFQVPEAEQRDVVAFVQSLKTQIVE